MHQSLEEINNEKDIGKDQCPNDHPLETDFNPSAPLCCTDSQYLISIHLFFRSVMKCSKRNESCVLKRNID